MERSRVAFTARAMPLAIRDVGSHPVRSAHDREVLGQLHFQLPDHCAQRLPELADLVCPEPLFPALLDVPEQRSPDLLRLPPGRRRADDPVPTKPSSASPSVPLRLRRRVGRVGADEHVSPPLHTTQRREHSRFRQLDGRRKLTDCDALADDAHEVRPHHQRHAEPATKAGLGEPALELVVELDRERNQHLGQRRRHR